jgi:hypothetical protein
MPTLADVALRDAFEFNTTEADWAGMCDQFAEDVSARVSSLQPDVVVVRQADFSQNGRVGDGPRLRLVVEGAIAAAAIKHIANTVLRRGKGCANVYPGKSKDKMDADGRSLVDKAALAEAAGQHCPACSATAPKVGARRAALSSVLGRCVRGKGLGEGVGVTAGELIDVVGGFRAIPEQVEQAGGDVKGLSRAGSFGAQLVAGCIETHLHFQRRRPGSLNFTLGTYAR